MFIDARVSPAKASRSTSRRLIGNRPPKIGKFISSAPCLQVDSADAGAVELKPRGGRWGKLNAIFVGSSERCHDDALSQFCHSLSLLFRPSRPRIKVACRFRRARPGSNGVDSELLSVEPMYPMNRCIQLIRINAALQLRP